MFTRILVPLDGSQFAEKALPHAELLARIYGADIVLMRVLEPLIQHDKPVAVDPLTWQIRKSEAELYLQDITKLVEERNAKPDNVEEGDLTRKWRVEYAIREGRTPESIVNFAHNENIDLLVISTHGWGGFTRWNISSVAEKVIKKIYLPVLLVRAYEENEDFSPQIQYRRILVPVDSSRRAEVVVATGISLARGVPFEPENLPESQNAQPLTHEPDQSTLIFATVIRPPELPIPEPYGDEVKQLVNQLMQYSHHAANEYLERMCHQVSANCEVKVVEDARVSTALQKLAEDEDVDLILMAAHGYSGETCYPYGSVTRDLMENGSKPIFVIQDLPLSMVQISDSEKASLKTGGR